MLANQTTYAKFAATRAAAPRRTITPGAASGSAITTAQSASASATVTSPPIEATPTSRGTPAAASAGPTQTHFQDPQGQFSFYLPAGWHILQNQTPGVVAQIASTTPTGNASVATDGVTNTTTLDQYVAATIAALQRTHGDYQFDAAVPEVVTLGGKPARLFEFSGVERGTRLRFIQYVALVGPTAYVLTLATPDADRVAFLDQAKLLLDTFTFSPNPRYRFTSSAAARLPNLPHYLRAGFSGWMILAPDISH